MPRTKQGKKAKVIRKAGRNYHIVRINGKDHKKQVMREINPHTGDLILYVAHDGGKRYYVDPREFGLTKTGRHYK